MIIDLICVFEGLFLYFLMIFFFFVIFALLGTMVVLGIDVFVREYKKTPTHPGLLKMSLSVSLVMLALTMFTSVIPWYSNGLLQFLMDGNKETQKCQARYNKPTNEVTNNEN